MTLEQTGSGGLWGGLSILCLHTLVCAPIYTFSTEKAHVVYLTEAKVKYLNKTCPKL